jgi:hypothetical protein
MLNEVLPEADVVFVSVPHTKKSEGMMGAQQFEAMKKGSYFIAVSRGKTYDHNALVKAPRFQPAGRSWAGRNRSGAAAQGPPALEVQECDHYAAHFRRLGQSGSTPYVSGEGEYPRGLARGLPLLNVVN